MNQQNRVEIVDGNGWRKEFPLDKNLLHIGSDARNDVVLEPWRGTGVAQRNLQLIAIPGEEMRYRAVNLSDQNVLLGPEGDQTLAPRSMVEIGSGDQIRLGDFTLVFRLGGAEAGAAVPVPARSVPRAGLSGARARGARSPGPGDDLIEDEPSNIIGLKLSLPSTFLEPDHPLEGIVTVHNMGNQPGVQFRLELQGLDDDCYEIGPGPVLFPNVEKGVFLRLNHPRRPEPPAGLHRIRVRATAPDAYPGERASVSQEIEFLPYYHHSVSLVAID